MTGRWPGRGRRSQKAEASGDAQINQVAGDQHAVVIGGRAHVDRMVLVEKNQGTIELHVPELPHSVPAQLPPDLADFTGRSAELGRLRECVAAGTPGGAVLITAISGKPGVGKSSLVQHFGHELAGRFPDGQLYVDLRGAEDEVAQTTGDVLGWFLRSLGVREYDVPDRVSERAALYRSRLANRRVLVVLDNARDEAQVRPLLPGASGCLVLVTSRRWLALEGAEVLPLDLFSAEEAIELLRRIAGDGVDAEPEHAAEVVRLCGYLPLAVRIAGTLAARRSWTPARLAARLADEHKRLSRLKHGDLDVRAAFTLSYRELSGPEAHLFRLLGTLVTLEFDADLAGALLGEEREADPTDLLDALADATLIEEIASARFHIHDLIRLFARELLNQEGDAAVERARDRMLTWYGQKMNAAVQPLTRRPGQDVDDDPEQIGAALKALEWLDAEVPALLSAMELAASAQHPGFLATSMAVLHPFLQSRRAWSAMERMARAEESFAEIAGDSELLAGALEQAGQAQWQQGAFDRAVTTLSHARDVARSGGLAGYEIDIQMMLARVFSDMRDDHRFQEAMRSARALARETGDRERAVRLDSFEALVAATASDVTDYDAQYARLVQVLAEARAGGQHGLVARTLIIMGTLQHRRSKGGDAALLWQEALQIALDSEDEHTEANARENLATYYIDAGDHQRAREHCERALPIFLRIGQHEYAATMSLFLARMARDRSDWPSAAEHYALTATLFEELGEDFVFGMGNMRLNLGDALSRLGRLDEAERELRRAQEILSRFDTPL
ncbi:tetratricopeptide repeat protein, partial [Actinomadura sp. NPDC048032]|uniref:ATP-binding protein n=1 Tax=Actinomadura sp. NPDC048032 TaxID=3155747 RepID=UPI0033D52763